MPDQEADEYVVSDPELITRVRTGDREAFGELYKRHSGAATTLSRQFARSATESDDLVSESFARVLDNLLAGKGPDTAFRAYLFTTIRNTAYDRTRKDKRLQFTDDMTTHDVAVVGDDPVLAKMESGLVATAFAQLPERWQAVLWHTQVEGETPAQVGALLGMAPGAVSSLAFRAREGLREAYLQAHLAETAAEQCRTTVERLGAWTRGGLSKREKAQVDAHLETCDRCRALAAELEEVNHGLRGLLAPLLLGGAAAGYLATLGPVAPLAAPGTLIAGAGAAGTGRDGCRWLWCGRFRRGRWSRRRRWRRGGGAAGGTGRLCGGRRRRSRRGSSRVAAGAIGVRRWPAGSGGATAAAAGTGAAGAGAAGAGARRAAGGRWQPAARLAGAAAGARRRPAAGGQVQAGRGGAAAGGARPGCSGAVHGSGRCQRRGRAAAAGRRGARGRRDLRGSGRWRPGGRRCRTGSRGRRCGGLRRLRQFPGHHEHRRSGRRRERSGAEQRSPTRQPGATGSAAGGISLADPGASRRHRPGLPQRSRCSRSSNPGTTGATNGAVVPVVDTTAPPTDPVVDGTGAAGPDYPRARAPRTVSPDCRSTDTAMHHRPTAPATTTNPPRHHPPPTPTTTEPPPRPPPPTGADLVVTDLTAQTLNAGGTGTVSMTVTNNGNACIRPHAGRPRSPHRRSGHQRRRPVHPVPALRRATAGLLRAGPCVIEHRHQLHHRPAQRDRAQKIAVTLTLAATRTDRRRTDGHGAGQVRHAHPDGQLPRRAEHRRLRCQSDLYAGGTGQLTALVTNTGQQTSPTRAIDVDGLPGGCRSPASR